MKTQRIAFNEVSITGVKRWKNSSGKWKQKTRKFYQTINPFNTINGRQKTREEIMKEIINERDEWLKSEEYIECDQCDGCGWYEGGPTIRTVCKTCNGTGKIVKL